MARCGSLLLAVARLGLLAEVDGNRTRRRRITTTTRFEGGGCHQVTGHLRAGSYLFAGRVRPRKRGEGGGGSLRFMKKLLFLAILVTLGVLAAKKLRVD